MTTFQGWTPNPEASKKYAQKVGTLSEVAKPLIGSGDQQDVFLWKPLLDVHPHWKRGAQGIGDCVSWGAELACTMLLAIQSKLGVSEWKGEVATEPLYGGARVEAQGKREDRGGDGTYGAAAADWVHKWGVLLRADYSSVTGSPDDDLRKYDAKKAKHYGRYGCGGRDDKGKLDKVAKLSPVQGVVQIRSVDEAVAAIANGYPITIASMYGTDMKRDSNGICYRKGEWGHQMMIAGTRWRNGRPEFRCFQSWGNSVSGPDPVVDKRIGHCSWWMPEQDAAWVFASGDCWSFADVEGFPPRELDFAKAFGGW